MADIPTSLFVDAAPVAVFSILADLENRPRVLKNVRKTVLRTSPPVKSGTRYREWRDAPIRRWGRDYRVGEFQPPDRFSLLQWQAGARLESTFRLAAKHGGTQIVLDVSGRYPLWPWFPLATVARTLARLWERRLLSDLADIKRHASMRANPRWREGLSADRRFS